MADKSKSLHVQKLCMGNDLACIVRLSRRHAAIDPYLAKRPTFCQGDQIRRKSFRPEFCQRQGMVAQSKFVASKSVKEDCAACCFSWAEEVERYPLQATVGARPIIAGELDTFEHRRLPRVTHVFTRFWFLPSRTWAKSQTRNFVILVSICGGSPCTRDSVSMVLSVHERRAPMIIMSLTMSAGSQTHVPDGTVLDQLEPRRADPGRGVAGRLQS